HVATQWFTRTVQTVEKCRILGVFRFVQPSQTRTGLQLYAGPPSVSRGTTGLGGRLRRRLPRRLLRRRNGLPHRDLAVDFAALLQLHPPRPDLTLDHAPGL